MTVSEPAGKVVTASLALPPASVAVPSVVDPNVKVMVPVGVAYDDVTVAVNVTDLPWIEGFFEEATVVVVAAWVTDWFKGADVLLRDDASPP